MNLKTVQQLACLAFAATVGMVANGLYLSRTKKLGKRSQSTATFGWSSGNHRVNSWSNAPLPGWVLTMWLSSDRNSCSSSDAGTHRRSEGMLKRFRNVWTIIPIKLVCCNTSNEMIGFVWRWENSFDMTSLKTGSRAKRERKPLPDAEFWRTWSIHSNQIQNQTINVRSANFPRSKAKLWIHNAKTLLAK